MRFYTKTVSVILLVLFVFSLSGASAENGFTLPANVTSIEDEAFYGVPIRQLRLPEGVCSIGSRAFAYTGLELIYLPQSVQHIEPDAFEGCAGLMPAVYPGSYADQWCKDRNMTTWRIIGLGVDVHTQDEIRAFITAHPSETSSATTYRRSPTVDPYVPGLVSEESIQNAINMLNQIRFIAGLNADVKNDPTKEEMMAAAAMANGLNGGLSHYPSRPAVWADSQYDDLYDLACSGAGSSNLSAGRSNLAASILMGYMYDSGSSNIDRVGHRRWILNPKMGKTAFGYYASSSSYYGAYSGMYAFDRSGSGSQSLVAWPAQQTPVSHFISSSSYAWSVSFGSSLTISAIHVTLTRVSDGKVWNFASDQADGDFYINNDWYGEPGCVIFRPTGIGTVSAGDSFLVTISNETNHTILQYTVSFFQL